MSEACRSPERRDRLVQIVRQLPEATFLDLVDARFRAADESMRLRVDSCTERSGSARHSDCRSAG